jgi:hypothetical protein
MQNSRQKKVNIKHHDLYESLYFNWADEQPLLVIFPEKYSGHTE